MRLTANILYSAALFSFVGAGTVQTELVLSDAQVAPDGFSKSTILVNGASPGPIIKASKGDSLEINVRNELSDSYLETITSIHWHGIFQHHTNPFDGTSFVTQCPIVSGNSFRYQFNVGEQSGTFWYHGHQDMQLCDGLRGPLVIYDPGDPNKNMYDVDDDSTVISLYDQFHTAAVDALFSNPAGILVNGMGRYPGGPNTTLAITSVQQGKKYRLRLINMSCKAWITFSIDCHTLTIIEADGQAVNPVWVDSLTIHAGQRYSLILNANQSVDNYWIRALPINYASNFTNGLNSAILRYKGAAEVEPQYRDVNNVVPLDETWLTPRDYVAVPGQPYPGGTDISISLLTTFNSSTVDHWVNGLQYHSPSIPTLLQILSGSAGIAQLASQGSVYTVPANKSVEISFPASHVLAPHPWHLHGHAFHVVRSAGSQHYNYANPVIRDTVSMGNKSSNDNVTIRFITDNSGPWFLHCHIDFHLYKGMAVVLAEAPDEAAVQNPVNDDWKQLCPAYNQSLGNESR